MVGVGSATVAFPYHRVVLEGSCVDSLIPWGITQWLFLGPDGDTAIDEKVAHQRRGTEPRDRPESYLYRGCPGHLVTCPGHLFTTHDLD